MPNAIAVRIGHEQAHLVAREAASLRRLVRHALGGKHEVQRVNRCIPVG
jgi:hypothetical protein